MLCLLHFSSLLEGFERIEAFLYIRNILAFANSSFLSVFDIVSILGDSSGRDAVMSQQSQNSEALSMKQSKTVQFNPHGC